MERTLATEMTAFDEVLSEAHRVRDLLTGASALIRSNDPATALQQIVSAARAGADTIVDRLERAMAVAAERERHHAQAAKHVGQEVRP